MKKILITGSKGQLGNEMRVISARYPAYSFVFTDVDELDITNSDALRLFFAEERPDFVVNCAAYTAVDKAEDDVEMCYKINRNAVRNLGAVTGSVNAKIIHVSTDYVFDGTSHIPYTEDMPVSPATVYGKSKLAGEQTLMDVCPQSVVIRTSWLYSSFGNNFVKTMMKLGNERETLGVIYDQVGSPTYAADLAMAIMKVIDAENFVPGIYHFSDEGVCSWYDFTKAIHAIAGITTCDVKPIESKEYKVRTPRPHYSVLNKAKIKSTYGIEIPYWKDSLKKCINLLIGE